MITIVQQVYLSRRNLLTLLKKLDDPFSEKTIVKNDTRHRTYPCSDHIIVTAVEDEDYYTDREPGPMKEDYDERGLQRWMKRIASTI